MKVKLLTSLCGADFSHHAGDEIEVSDKEALNLINAGFAEAENKEAFDNLVEKINKADVENERKKAEIEAILYKEELEKEKQELLNRVAEIDSILNEKESSKKSAKAK